MLRNGNELQQLAARARRGDSQAMLILRQKLEHHTARIVRRAMNSTGGSSTLTQRIRATADRLVNDKIDSSDPDSEQLVRWVAGDLCESVVNRLRPCPEGAWNMGETVRN
jgi:hypothetical protein